MENYYKNLISDIEHKIADKKYYEANKLIQKEFTMPYIPLDIEEELIKLQDSIQYWLIKPEKQMSIDDILLNMNLNGEKQFNAISNLVKLNLRDYIGDIQNFFDNNSNSLAYALLVDSLITQNIDYIFKINYLNKEYKINFSKETSGIDSDCFNKTKEILKLYFENDDVSVYQLTLQLLIQEFYLRAPFNPDINQAKAIANTIGSTVLEMLGLNVSDYALIDLQNTQKVDLLCLTVVF